MCPRCGQSAPIVYRGVAAYCAACGAPRVPLTAPSVTLAGQPSRVGGVLARAAGWVVLALGLVLALTLAAIGQFAAPGGAVGWALGGGTAALAVLSSVLLLRSGARLHAGGRDARRQAEIAAIFAMAPLRGGVLRAGDVASALSLPIAPADALLTDLAKADPDRVALEIDEHGGVYYRVAAHGLARVRVAAPREPSQAPPVYAEPSGAAADRRRASS